MENLQWPRIVYHLSKGNRRAEKGTGDYTYQSCGSLEEFEALGPGWKLTPQELDDNIKSPVEINPIPSAEEMLVDKSELLPQLAPRKKVAKKTR